MHTYLSQDAYIGGARVMSDEAYRFAKGEVVRTGGGQDPRLRQPLDFLMVADHAGIPGEVPRLAAGDAEQFDL